MQDAAIPTQDAANPIDVNGLPCEPSSMRCFARVLGKLLSPLIGGIAFLVVLSAWQFAAAIGVIDPRYFGTPTGILQSYATLFSAEGEILPHLLVSAKEGALGIALALMVGLPVGLMMGRYRWVRRSLEPIIMGLNATPRVAFLPFIIMTMGVGIESKILLIFVGSIFPILVNAQTGVENVDPSLIEAMVSLRATERQIFLKLVLPSVIPYVITGLRLAIGLALIMIVVAEFYAASEGIGYFINGKASAFLMNDMLAGITFLSLVGVVLNTGLRRMERVLSPWRYTT